MDKYFVKEDGTKWRMSPLSLDEYCNLIGYTLPSGGYTYLEFLEANNWIDMEFLSAHDRKTGHMEIWDGDALLHWVDGEWQAEYPHKAGFPQDDEFSLMQGDFGDCANLDIFYSSQYVQNEEQKTGVKEPGLHFDTTANFLLEKVPILEKSMVGNIYLGEQLVQTFIDNNPVTFTEVGKPYCKVKKMTINYITAEVKTEWTSPVDLSEVKLLVSYEYNLECGPEPKYKPYKKPVKNEVKIEEE